MYAPKQKYLRPLTFSHSVILNQGFATLDQLHMRIGVANNNGGLMQVLQLLQNLTKPKTSATAAKSPTKDSSHAS